MLYLCPLQINYYYNKNKNDNKSKQRTEQIKQKMKQLEYLFNEDGREERKGEKKKVRNRKQVSSFYLLLSLEKFSSFLRQNLLHNTK